MSEQAAPLIVNKGELARIFRVSMPTIDGWIAEQCPVQAGGSNGVPYEFDVSAVKEWREEIDRKRGELEQERQRRIALAQGEMFQGERLAPEGISHVREALEAERLAIIVGQQKGQLVALEDVRADYAAVFGVVRQHMLGWAATLTRAAGLNGPQQEEADRLVRETLIAMHGQIKRPDLRPALDAD